MKLNPALAFALLLGCSASAFAQSAGPEATALAAAFSDKRDVTKTKRNVTLSKYREVVSRPWTSSNLRDYAGRYEGDDGDFITIRVDDRGVVSGAGHDDAGAYELSEIRIKAGALQAVKSYTYGGHEPLSAAFLDRSSRTSPDAVFQRAVGIGYLKRYMANGTRRIFLRKT